MIRINRVLGVVASIALLIVIALLLARGCNRASDEGEIVSPEPETPPVTIVLDPGHGGWDPGGVAGDVLEKDLNLAIVERIKALIDRDHPEIRPVLTRTMDVAVDKLDRLKRAEEVGAACYVSVHVNACDYPEVYGAETWVDDTRPQNDLSWTLARSIQDALILATGTRDRGVRSQEMYLQHTTIPAISMEVGFLTNAEERAKLVDSGYQDQIAQGIIQGILTYLDATGTRPASGT
jgi:N-acetylmuramoyl-L-alanine amidase